MLTILKKRNGPSGAVASSASEAAFGRLLSPAGRPLVVATGERPPRGSRCGRTAAPARTAAGRPTGTATRRRSTPRPDGPATWWGVVQVRVRPSGQAGGTSPGTTRRCCRACRKAPRRWQPERPVHGEFAGLAAEFGEPLAERLRLREVDVAHGVVVPPGQLRLFASSSSEFVAGVTEEATGSLRSVGVRGCLSQTIRTRPGRSDTAVSIVPRAP
jgi:hypothetical protein